MRRLAVLVLATGLLAADAFGATCESVVHDLNRKLSPKVNEEELVQVLQSLNSSRNRRLPDQFVTKRQARLAGWSPGKSLWSRPALKGKSIGGDEFRNLEGRLPDKHWREADLDYRGGKRGAKRIVFSTDGLRMVTVDHYRTFTEVPPCQ